MRLRSVDQLTMQLRSVIAGNVISINSATHIRLQSTRDRIERVCENEIVFPSIDRSFLCDRKHIFYRLNFILTDFWNVGRVLGVMN